MKQEPLTFTADAAVRAPTLPGVDVGRDVARATAFDEQAHDFLERHPEFWALFVRFVDEAVLAGRSRIGAKLVCERIRWEHAMRRDEEDAFAINNNHVSSVARIYCATYPEHAHMLVQRARPSERVRDRARSVTYVQSTEE